MADNFIEKQYSDYEARKAAMKQHAPQRTKHDVGHTYRVFVTGGAKGIGHALVRAFCEARYKVAFCDCNESAGWLTALQTGARFFLVDVADVPSLEACMDTLFAEWGDIDVVINNAGISSFAPLDKCSAADFDHVLAVNLRPVFVTARRLTVHRNSLQTLNGYGRIINICSTRYLMSEAGCEAYAASKGGVFSLTHALAVSMAPLKVTVNALSPGWIETGDYDALRPADHKQHPSGRVGCPEDVARLALFLCEPNNDFINGENIVVDGGMTRKMIYAE